MQEVDYNNYKVPTMGSFLKLEQGDNKIRICSKPIELKYVEISGKGEKYATENIENEAEEKEAILSGKKIKVRYAYLVINRADGKLYIWECGISIFRDILTYATNPEYGDPTQYDLNINKSGEKLSTRYMIVPARKSTPFTESEIEMIATNEGMLREQYKQK